ncbi:MAG: NAD-glutamate dehydrogenase, partial [Planctomycetota bacterium]|nr:NAD-glutamate dehydrogenase [Planctomycetota bacterium]
LDLQERPHIAFFPRHDPFGRFVSCLVYVPREQYDTDFRIRIQKILSQAYDGEILAYYTMMQDTAHARLHFIVKTTPGDVPIVDRDVIEHELIEAGRSWSDHLRDALIDEHGEHGGLQLFRVYGKAFSSAYRDSFSPAVGVHDIASIEQALTGTGFAQNLYRPVEAEPHQVRYKVCSLGAAAPLSDALPVLENMGLRVYREIPYRIRPEGKNALVWLRDFELVAKDKRPIDLVQIRDGFHEAVEDVWNGAMENDGFNMLVLRAGLTSRQVTVLRAYCKYLRQAGITFSQEYMEETLANHTDVARWLVRLFEVRFDPDHEGDRDVDALALVERIFGELENVSNLDDDRILRAFLMVVDATLRTNYYQRGADGEAKAYLAFKLNSQAIPQLPKPRPMCEIFVYSPRVEAIHLRGGRVARGGIRWSDRREDFRTEILGLMKAQMVKNTVIVPVGSKGGFVVKQPPESWEELKLEVVACYRILMSGLLDLTDNLDGADILPPERVVRRDGDDPYLVVAADKGTATFSDTANEISADYDFWLDDAFASGGSAGYDHKVMGITARGAWESVKRHFRETGKDIQAEPFTVAGVGDMSGDVFGNGMLLSEQIRLVAAFNHLHIFVDPDPDPATSFAERKRLFDLPGSTWDDYQRSAISTGGGVWSRSKKSIPLSPEMQVLFGLEESAVTPNELVSAILKSDVELLWFGGIGTYVKASREGHTAAGDRANDAVRIDATQLRARVIGEGANLAMTQKARVEFDLRGGRMYTDFIDNSAGVDCSDHEVNIKILLGEIEREGDITRKQRNELLEAMTDEVAQLVLRDNYLQTQSVSVTHRLGAHLLDRQGRFMRTLEKAGLLDRGIEDLPDDEELSERLGRGDGLTRPELCTLLSYAKMTLYDELRDSDLPDDPYLLDDLMEYFPTPLQTRFPDAIQAHRLRREIVATMVTNEMLNRAGISFVHEVREKTGHAASEIARAYLVCRTIFELPTLQAEIEALDNQVPSAAQAALLIECGRLLDRGTVWMLRHTQHPLDVGRETTRFGDGVREVMGHLDTMLGSDQKQTMAMRKDALRAEGAPEEIADRAARLYFKVPACAIVLLANDTEVPVEQVAATYFRVGSRFGFNWLRRTANRLPSDTAWDKLAVTSLVDDLENHQLNLTRRIMSTPNGDRAPDEMIDMWASTRRPLVSRAEQVVSELQAQSSLDFAMLAVASRQLNAMIG